jgi:hypothetical protein
MISLGQKQLFILNESPTSTPTYVLHNLKLSLYITTENCTGIFQSSLQKIFTEMCKQHIPYYLQQFNFLENYYD